MPITSSEQFFQLKPRIMRHVRNLVRSGALKLSADPGAPLTLGFAFGLQWVSTEDKTDLHFSQPDGIKILLVHEREVVASLDLHFKKERLKFSHAQTGPSLDSLVTALNMLAERYQDDRKRYSIIQLHFPIGRAIYFKVIGGGRSAYFRFTDGQLQSVNAKELKTHFYEIINSRKPLTPKL
jgi:hypothetical protein